MTRAVRALVALVVAFGGLVPIATQAQVSPVVVSGTISGIAASQPAVLSGQSTCAVALSGAATGVTIVPQATSDTQSNILNGSAVWVTASNVNSGSITYAGTAVTYPGNIVAAGITGFRLNVTAYGSGSPTYTITCNSAVGTNITTTPSGTQNVSVVNTPLPVTAATTIPVSAATTLPVSIATLPPIAFATTQPVSIQSSVPLSVNTPAPCTIPTCGTTTVLADGVTNSTLANILGNNAAANTTLPNRLPTSIPDEVANGSATSTGAQGLVYTNGKGTFSFILYGTFAATTTVQGITAGGISTLNLPIYSGLQCGVGATVTSVTVAGNYCVYAAGSYALRLNVTYTSGTMNYYEIMQQSVSPVIPATGTSGAANTAVNSSGATAPVACDKQAAVNISTATTTSIVAVSGSTAVYVCAYHLYVVSGTLPSFVIEGGTGAACVTTQAPLTGTFGGIAGAIGESFQAGSGIGAILSTAASSALCIVSGGTVPNIQGWLRYAQF
jgi:hypothetical protein